jgi:glutathione S-transferase
MKLYFSGASPFVRKVMVVAHEGGLSDAIEAVPGAAHPVKRDAAIVGHNPLGQVPTLILDDGEVLADSRVICEYLDARAGGRLFPAAPERWRVLAAQSLGDGLLDAALLARYERTVRAEQHRSDEWQAGQLDKIRTALALMEKSADRLGERVDIGTITWGCAVGYLDLRFPEIEWRKDHPDLAAWFARFDERPSMKATRPVG